MELSAAQMAQMSRLLDEVLPLDLAGRRLWLDQLAPECQWLAPVFRKALLMEPEVCASSVGLDTLPKMGAGQEGKSVAPGNLQPGEKVGPYELVRRLGAGGMAEVWLAQRIDGAFKREVALKVPMLSRLRRDLAPRFAHECGILAGLEHVNIARLYDAGVTADGLPYLAMEYVPGFPLTAWCDAQKLNIRERIELYLQVLDAVHYAHTHQVVHRDIKPSNILVTPAGEVRLLDFGVAKLLAVEDDTQTQLTQVYGRALTPDYASPEYLRGDPVDALSDVYSLGIVLYELLAGCRPYRFKTGASIVLPERATTEVQVQRPSAQLAPGAEAARVTTRVKLSRSLRGDLDAISLKALARAPQDRYPTVDALADDLKRHLKGDPVRAQPDRLLYRAGKFVLRHRGNTASAVGATLVVMAAIALALRYAPPSRVPVSDKSIAVLPFVDMSENKDQEYFSDGLSEELLNLLTRVPGLRVAARTSAFSFKGKTDDIPTIARKLMVANVLEGSVRKSGTQLRITAQLVRADNGYQMWSQTYDRQLDDIFKVQGEIATSVAQALKASLLAGTSLTPAGTQNTDAYALYLQARSLILRGGGRTDWETIVGKLKQVLVLDPTFAPAWAWYSHGRSEQSMRGYLPGSQGYEEGRRAAYKALALDPTLPEAHDALAKVLLLYDWDWSQAQAEIQRSLDLDPGNWTALQWSGILAEELGNFDDAAEQLKKASAVDPLMSYSMARLARTYYKAGRLAEARIAYDRAVALKSPADEYVPSMGGLLFLEKGDFKGALGKFDSSSEEETRLFGRALTYYALGRREDADSTLADYEGKYASVSAFGIAAVHAYRGEADKAFAWLDRAYQQREFALVDIKGDPLFRNVRTDPRFKTFLRKMNLPV